MKTLLYASLFMVSLIFLCACQPTQVPASDVQSNIPTDSNQNPSLNPNSCAVGVIPTTAGGCVTVRKVNQFNLSYNYTVIGFTRYLNQDAILLERSNGSFNTWDLFALPDSTQVVGNVSPICSVTKPGQTYDLFRGLAYSAGIFHTMSLNTGVIIYDIQVSNCSVTKGLTLQVANNNATTFSNYLGYDGTSYTYSFDALIYQQANANLNVLTFRSSTIAGDNDSPLKSNLVLMNSDSRFWYIAQNSNRVWRTNTQRTPDAWFSLPTSFYSDLYNVLGLSWSDVNHLHAVTMVSNSNLKVFTFDVSDFSGGAQ